MSELIDWNRFWNVQSPFKIFAWKIYEKYRSKSYIKMLKNINLNDKSIAELGGGSGYLLGIISKNVCGECTKAFVVDNNKEAYNTYKKSGAKLGVKYIKEDLFEHKEKYDVVMSDGLIEHFQKNERIGLFAVHKKLMKDNGLCIIFVPKNSWLIRNIFTMRYGYEKKFTPDELKNEAMESGFNVIKSISDMHMTGILCKVND